MKSKTNNIKVKITLQTKTLFIVYPFIGQRMSFLSGLHKTQPFLLIHYTS